MTKEEKEVYTLEEFNQKIDEINKNLESVYEKKSKPFVNEIQLSLVHHQELIERAFYFMALNDIEYMTYKNMFESFKDAADNYLNHIRGVEKLKK